MDKLTLKDHLAKNRNKLLVGMVHLKALPGTPLSKLSVSEISEAALSEARQLKNAGFDMLLIENMHDRPYLKLNVGPEITAAFTRISRDIYSELSMPFGIQVLAAANVEALAIAHATDAAFIRAESFSYAHIADEGFIEACAGKLLRARRVLNAEQVSILADVKKKHASHSITSDISVNEQISANDFFLADGAVITGKSTGHEADLEEVKLAKSHFSTALLAVGSGITADNISKYYPHANMFIVGSYLKRDGLWANEMELDRLNKMSESFHKLRD